MVGKSIKLSLHIVKLYYNQLQSHVEMGFYDVEVGKNVVQIVIRVPRKWFVVQFTEYFAGEMKN